jgi:hypothetical protein
LLPSLATLTATFYVSSTRKARKQYYSMNHLPEGDLNARFLPAQRKMQQMNFEARRESSVFLITGVFIIM